MRQDDQRIEAERALNRARREAESLGSSSMARAGRGLLDHFAGRDAEESDPIEVWGRRIGRALSLVGVVVLLGWLGLQLGWWSP